MPFSQMSWPFDLRRGGAAGGLVRPSACRRVRAAGLRLTDPPLGEYAVGWMRCRAAPLCATGRTNRSVRA